MTTKLKIRSYAIFQFISFFALILILTAGVLMAYTVILDPNNSSNSLAKGSTWLTVIGSVMGFEKLETVGIFASLLTYISLITFIASWVAGWMIFRVPNRNLFDSLFLLFLCLPIISNIFALFAQVATKEITFSSSKIDKKAVVIEQTRILDLEEKSRKRKEAALNKKRKAAAKAKLEAAKTQELKLKEAEAATLAKLEAPVKKATTKKPIARKTPVKKGNAKKPTVKKLPAKKPAAKKAPAKKGTK